MTAFYLQVIHLSFLSLCIFHRFFILRCHDKVTCRIRTLYAYIIALPSQEEIKIISADVFVNPYAESDEEEEEKTNEDNIAKDEDNVSFRLLMRLYCLTLSFSSELHLFPC